MSIVVESAISEIAPHIRAMMTPEETRYAADEAYNVYLALGLDDADVLYVIASRAIAHNLYDFDAFALGYAHGFTGLSRHARTRAYRLGYAEGNAARTTSPVGHAAD